MPLKKQSPRQQHALLEGMLEFGLAARLLRKSNASVEIRHAQRTATGEQLLISFPSQGSSFASYDRRPELYFFPSSETSAVIETRTPGNRSRETVDELAGFLEYEGKICISLFREIQQRDSEAATEADEGLKQRVWQEFGACGRYRNFASQSSGNSYKTSLRRLKYRQICDK